MLAGANGIGHNSLPGDQFGEEEVEYDIFIDRIFICSLYLFKKTNQTS